MFEKWRSIPRPHRSLLKNEFFNKLLTRRVSAISPQPAFVRPLADGIEIKLKVVPGASRSQIVGPLGDRLKVKVAAPPEDGKANRAVVELLARWLGTEAIEIVAGHGHPEKTVWVRGLDTLSDRQLACLK